MNKKEKEGTHLRLQVYLLTSVYYHKNKDRQYRSSCFHLKYSSLDMFNFENKTEEVITFSENSIYLLERRKFIPSSP